LSVGELRVLQLGDLNCLAGAGMTHSVTADSYYHDSRSTVAVLEKDALRESVRTTSLSALTRPFARRR
jgi:hypothetical protein